jgi:hypothetical protein
LNVDLVDSTKTYAMVAVNEIDLRRILSALCPADQREAFLNAIPPWVTVRVENPLVSFAASPTGVIAADGTVIPGGFRIRGGIRIFDLPFYMEALVSPSAGIVFNATLPPLRVANIMTITKSAEDRANGPSLGFVATYGNTGTTAGGNNRTSGGGIPKLSVFFEGHVKLTTIVEAYALIDISQVSVNFNLKALIYQYLNAEIRFYGSVQQLSTTDMSIL